jgi:uncharacterized membrane protein
MDDRIRVSDADRDRVTARLREHFAEGRLTPDELDQRLSATLNAKTFGDLRGVMTDLPEPAHVPSQAAQRPQRAAPPWMARRHGPRILPLILLALLAALLIPGGGWLLFAFFKIVLVFWLVTSLVAVLGIGRSYRRMRRSPQSGYLPHWRSRARWGQVPCGRRSEQHMTSI